MTTRYFPDSSGWYVLCGRAVLLAVVPTTPMDRIGSLWAAVSAADSAAPVLDEITRGGISNAPDFAMIHVSGKAGTLFVRGSVRAFLAGEPVDGSGATAWLERSFAPGVAVELRFRDESWPIEQGLPIAEGVVRGAGLHTGEVTTAARPPVVSETTRIAETIAEAPPGIATSPVPGAVSSPAGYDHLFGETVIRSVEEAAVRDESAEPAVEDRTRVATDLEARRALRRAARATANRPTAGPRLWVDLSTGGTELLDRVIIVGRAPSASRVTGGELPKLLTMSTPNQDISRTHAQLAVEGGTVVVTDLHSSNGTFVTLPGRAPQKLRGGEPTTVIVGTVIDLGDGATLTLREEA
jgi:hypothetical protein